MAIPSTSIAASFLLHLFLLVNLTISSHQLIGVIGPSPSPSPSPLPGPGPAPSPGGMVSKMNCAAACEGRCKESSRPHLCKRACGSCCHRCNCVPPGTYGNYEACPCYFNLKTHHQARKCP